MDTILRLYDEQDISSLTQRVEKLSSKELGSCLKTTLSKEPEKCPRIFRAIFAGLPLTNSCNRQRQDVFLRGCHLLQQGDLSQSLVSQIFRVLLENCKFPPENAVELCTFFTESIKSGKYGTGKWLELFPPIVSQLLSFDKVPFMEGHMTGMEYQSHVINNICSERWPANLVVCIATMFNDFSLEDEELKLVLQKLIMLLHDIEYDNIPSLVYQTLVLSIKGHRRLVLNGLIDFFNEEEKRFSLRDSSREIDLHVDDDFCKGDDLRRCEGTVLLHMLLGIVNNNSLGTELIKLFKTFRQLPRKMLSPFTFALALCISHEKQFQQPIYDSLKCAIIHNYKERELQESSYLVRELADDIPVTDDDIMSVVSASAAEWDHVTQGLVEFGFMLVDTFSGRMASCKGSKDSSPFGKACSLGSKIILTVFKHSKTAQRTILSEVLDHIVPFNTIAIDYYIGLFRKVVQQSVTLNLDCSGKIRDVLTFLLHFPASKATELLQSFQPVVQRDEGLKNAVMLLMRKALFSRELESRKVALNFFVNCLKSSHNMRLLANSQGSFASQCSQYHVDVHSSLKPAESEAFCLEILGILRRALTQQADIRIILYNGIPDAVSENTFLVDVVLDLLLLQANMYIEPGATPCLRLPKCFQISGSQLLYLEPLPQLVRCIQRCVKFGKLKYDKPSDQSNVSSQEQWTHPLMILLEDLTAAMIKTDLEEFEMGKSTVYDTSTITGKKNVLCSTLILGVYESLIEYSYLHLKFSPQMARNVTQLFNKYSSLLTLLKDKNIHEKKGGSSKGKQTTSKQVCSRNLSLLSCHCLTSLLKAILLNNIPEHQEALLELRQNTDFNKYLLTTAMQKVQQIQECGYIENEAINISEMFHYCCVLGRLMINAVSEDHHPNGHGQDDSFVLKCIEVLVFVVNAVLEKFPDKVMKFVGGLDKVTSSQYNDATETELHCVIKKIEHMVSKSLNSSEGAKFKECGPLLKLIYLLVSYLPCGSQHFKDVFLWVYQLCNESAFEDAALVKSLLTLFLKMSGQTLGHFPLLKKLSSAIHRVFGDIEDEENTEIGSQSSRHFQIINDATASTVVLLLMNHIDTSLRNVEWIINRFKIKISSCEKKSLDTETHNKHEKGACSSLAALTSCLHELISSSLPIGAATDTVLHLLTKHYSIMYEFTKYQLSFFGVTGRLCPHFEKLVNIINSHLTPQVYILLSYIHAVTQNAKRPSKNSKLSSSDLTHAMKETKSMSQLIFSREQFERYLIQLSKKSKTDLVAKMKLSTNRDFRIDMSCVQEALRNVQEPEGGHEEQAEESGTLNNSTEESNENDCPPSKRKRK